MHNSASHIKLNWRTGLQVLSLVVGLAGSVALFLAVWPDRFWLRLVSLFLASFYVLWGGFAHTRSGTFSKRVLGEYASIAGLGVLMLWLII